MTQPSEIDRLKCFFQRFMSIHDTVSNHLPSDLANKELSECSKFKEHLEREEFPIAFFSLFSGDKSTVINALLEQNLLPTGIACTAEFPTFIRSGNQNTARITYKDGSDKYLNDLNDLVDVKEYAQRNDAQREEARRINRIEIGLMDTRFPVQFTLVDLPGGGDTGVDLLGHAQRFIETEPRAFVFCSGTEDAPFDNQDGNSFFEALSASNADVLDRSFLLINQWDSATEGRQRDATDKFNDALETNRTGFPRQRIYKISARNFLRLHQLESNASGDYQGIDALEKYGDLDALFANPLALIERHEELREFHRFKSDLIDHITHTAVAELCASARSSLLKAVEALSGALSNQLDTSFDSDDEAALLADLQERFVDRTFSGLKKELDIALDQFQQEFKKLSPIQWDESAQANLMAEIRQILDEEGAQKIFDAVDGCGIAVPAMPKFLTEVFETINLDFKIIEALQNAARTHQIVEGLKLKLRKIFNMLWFPALEQRIDTELNPQLIENRLHGILENIHPWKQWHQNISQTVSDVNAEAIEGIISAIDDLLTQNRERLRERTGRTMEIHFRRFTLPNLKGMFGKQGVGANDLATGMKSKMRVLLNNPDSRYYEEYRAANGALSAMKNAQIELNILAAELYQQ